MTDQTSGQPTGNDVAAEFARTMSEDAEWCAAHPWMAVAFSLRRAVGDLALRLTDRTAGRHAAR